jgi:CRISPR-associated protein Csd2
VSGILNRYDFVLLFDVTLGNPNGDPDAGNMPRLDPETGCGLVTDVALKRKVRNYVALTKGATPGLAIYMQEGSVLNTTHRKAYEALGLEPDTSTKKAPKAQAGDLTRWMCENFYDVRTFGAMMSTEVNCGQVRGPVQLTFAQSIDPIVPLEVTVTRSSVTNERDALLKTRTMGRKHIVPYGLYRAHGFISARLANDPTKGTGFSEADLAIFWEALKALFEHDRAAARGEMATQAVVVFRHDSDLGNAPAHTLFRRVQVVRKGAEEGGPARRFEDYTVTVDDADLPHGVEIIRVL